MFPTSSNSLIRLPTVGFSLTIASFVKYVCSVNLFFWSSCFCCSAVASASVLNVPTVPIFDTFPVVSKSCRFNANFSPCFSTTKFLGLACSVFTCSSVAVSICSGVTVVSCIIPFSTFGASTGLSTGAAGVG